MEGEDLYYLIMLSSGYISNQICCTEGRKFHSIFFIHFESTREVEISYCNYPIFFLLLLYLGTGHLGVSTAPSTTSYPIPVWQLASLLWWSSHSSGRNFSASLMNRGVNTRIGPIRSDPKEEG